MLPAQRREKILREVQALGTTSIARLSQKYGVSGMTIRRDLQALEEEGHIKRTHGGALRQSEALIEPRYSAKQELNSTSKGRIAAYAAANLVDDGDIVLLEGGTTVTSMVRHLAPKQELTAITNGLYTATELGRLIPRATIICSGGVLRDASFTFVGPSAEHFFTQIHAQKVFLSATGLTLEAGCTDPSMSETQVKKAMARAAARVIVLLDSSKFGVVSLATVVQAADIDVLVTDDGAPRETLSALAELGVDVRVAPE
jgi:DeoR/GlpR family transcriptional regulator of sugar metabolism